MSDVPSNYLPDSSDIVGTKGGPTPFHVDDNIDDEGTIADRVVERARRRREAGIVTYYTEREPDIEMVVVVSDNDAVVREDWFNFGRNDKGEELWSLAGATEDNGMEEQISEFLETHPVKHYEVVKIIRERPAIDENKEPYLYRNGLQMHEYQVVFAEERFEVDWILEPDLTNHASRRLKE